MGEQNRVNVKIYGREYTIAGDAEREQIMRVADYVDARMKEIAGGAPHCSVTDLAVLAAANVADEYYRAVQENRSLSAAKDQLEKDTQHYVELWEEAKRNFVQYKEDAQSAREEAAKARSGMEEKSARCARLERQNEELQESLKALHKKNEDLVMRISAQEEDKATNREELKNLEEKCREVENSFFDLQMENLQLKGELDRYKKIVE